MTQIQEYFNIADAALPEADHSSNGRLGKAWQRQLAAFIEKRGRRPRILMTGPESKRDQSLDKIVANHFADLGFDVDISPPDLAVADLARLVDENDDHVVCVIGPPALLRNKVSEIKQALRAAKRDNIKILVVADASSKEIDSIIKAGAATVFRTEKDIIPFGPRLLDLLANRPSAPRNHDFYIKGVLSGNRDAVTRTITLIESELPEHRQLAKHIINDLLPHAGQAIRVGISGVPGVGKSSFIESFGKFLLDKGYRVAVLAVDPSSSKSGGSILGDQTRMLQLAREPDVLIRPSPTQCMLGGVTRRTRETIIVCEAAGYNVILVETVGVGQSEIAVASMVDFFLVLMLAGAGDEIQGIKKGILEVADAIAVNKADGDNIQKALEAKQEYTKAMHLIKPSLSYWTPPVLTCSAHTKSGIDDIWATILEHRKLITAAGEFTAMRRKQALEWMEALLDEALLERFFTNPRVKRQMSTIMTDVKDGILTPSAAAHELLSLHTKKE